MASGKTTDNNESHPFLNIELLQELSKIDSQFLGWYFHFSLALIGIDDGSFLVGEAGFASCPCCTVSWCLALGQVRPLPHAPMNGWTLKPLGSEDHRRIWTTIGASKADAPRGSMALRPWAVFCAALWVRSFRLRYLHPGVAHVVEATLRCFFLILEQVNLQRVKFVHFLRSLRKGYVEDGGELSSPPSMMYWCTQF